MFMNIGVFLFNAIDTQPSLGKQAVNGSNKVVELLIDKTTGQFHYTAVATNQHIACYARLAQRIACKNIGYGIQRHGVGSTQFCHILIHHLFCLLAVYTNKHKIGIILIWLPYTLFDVRHFPAAYPTPACSELQHDNLATLRRQRKLPAIGKWQSEVGGISAQKHRLQLSPNNLT